MRFFANEREFTVWALAAARERGWQAAHLSSYRVVRRKGQTVAIPDKDATGFPDLVLVHVEHGLVFVELKIDEKSKLKPEQVVWLRVLVEAGQRVYVFRAHEQDALVSLLDGEQIESMLFDRGAVTA